MPDKTPPITKVEPSSKGETPPDKNLTEDRVRRAGLENKIEHLTDKIERLKQMDRAHVGESLRKAEEALANVKESLNKL